MAGEISWKLPWRRLDARAVSAAAEDLVRNMPGVKVTVDPEDDDCVSCYFEVPDPDGDYVVELSFYDLGDGDIVFSVEEEWSDNAEAWDAACEMAERLAELLNAGELELD